MFAPELYISEDFEDPTGQLFADDSDQDDEMDQGKDNYITQACRNKGGTGARAHPIFSVISGLPTENFESH